MQDKLKIIIIFSIFMICTSSKIVYGYTGKGTETNPYVIRKEWELNEVLTQKSNDKAWVYVAVIEGINITNTITVKEGKFRIYAKGASRTIKRSSNLNTAINNKNDPKYCIKAMGKSQMVFGYKSSNFVLKLGGNKDNIPDTRKTSGWFNIDSSAAVTIDVNCHITNVRNNENEDSGAPVRTEGKLTINGEISNCVGVNGGAVKALSGEVIVKSNADIHNCFSYTEGGAIHISSGGKIAVTGGKIYECESKEEGGAIFISGGSRGEILSGEIYSNKSGQSAGGIFSGYGSTLVIGTTSGTGPRIYYNRASGSGGGIRCNGGVTETAGGMTYFYGGSILHNYSGKNGGGIACGAPGSKGSSKIIIQNIEVISNISEATAGGIWLPNEAKGINTDYVILDNCVISKNESRESTGGIMVHCSLKASDNNISKNICKSFGGGIFIDGGGCLTLSSGIIAENKCNENGEGIYVQGKLQIHSDAYVNADNKVYLTKGTFIEVVGELNKSEGYIAVIDSAVKKNGTKLVKAGYAGTDGVKELYYKGIPEDEYISKIVTKKYSCYELKDNQCLRPSNNVTGYDDKWIIISEKYTVSYNKNCGDTVELIPDKQTKFWNEDITLSSNDVVRKGYITDERKHWNVEADGNGECIMPGGTYSLNGNRQIYAQWLKIEVSKLFITAEDRYYVVGQNKELNNDEILKKVSVEDDLKTGNKYKLKIIQIKKNNGASIAKGEELFAEQYMNTKGTAKYEITIYIKDGNVESSAIFNIYVLDTLLQNGKTRFISNLYLNTLSRMSKWFGRLNMQLKASLKKVKGEGVYVINITNEKLIEIKQKVKSNRYKINRAMNKELAESW